MTRDPGVAAAAVILAGGRGARLGGVRKAELVVGGRRLLDVVLDACAGCAPVVVVGDDDLDVPEGVQRTREDPPFAGPAAGLAAGFAALRTGAHAEPEWLLCLGCDQPGVAGAVPALRRAAAEVGDDVDAISASAAAGASTPESPQLREVLCRIRTTPPEVRMGLGDSGHRIEWVVSILRTRALARRIADMGATGLVNCSMRRLLAPLAWAHTPVPAGATDDIDTWEDHARWLQRVVAI